MMKTCLYHPDVAVLPLPNKYQVWGCPVCGCEGWIDREDQQWISESLCGDPLPSLAGLAGGTLAESLSGLADDADVHRRGVNSSRLDSEHGRP
jgi:hypothetical protein